jgi:hypothetical protein
MNSPKPVPGRPATTAAQTSSAKAAADAKPKPTATSVTGEIITPAIGAKLGATYALKNHHVLMPLTLSESAPAGVVPQPPPVLLIAGTDYTVDELRGLVTILASSPSVTLGSTLTADYGYDAAAGAPAALRTDGPTLEQFVAAGYLAENYPPAGYAAVTTATQTGSKPKPTRQTVQAAAHEFAAGLIAHLTRAPSSDVRPSETGVHVLADNFAAAVADFVEAPASERISPGAAAG